MTRYVSIAVLLSVVLLVTQDASAKAPRRGMHAAQPRVAPFPPANPAAMGGFGYGWSPLLGAPAYGPVIGYMPVYGMGTSGFMGSYGSGGFSTTFATPSFGGHSGFSSPAYGRWGAFGK